MTVPGGVGVDDTAAAPHRDSPDGGGGRAADLAAASRRGDLVARPLPGGIRWTGVAATAAAPAPAAGGRTRTVAAIAASGLPPDLPLAVVVAGTTLLAFHRSVRNVVEVTQAGSLGGYVWVVPIAGALAALGMARRHRTELPIHDRQTDVIVGRWDWCWRCCCKRCCCNGMRALLHLLRLDLVAMWTFAVSASIALFGLRPVIRFGWVWLQLAMVFALPYYLTVIILGGTKVAAGIRTLCIAGSRSGSRSTARPPRPARVRARLGGGDRGDRRDGASSSRRAAAVPPVGAGP